MGTHGELFYQLMAVRVAIIDASHGLENVTSLTFFVDFFAEI